MSEPNRKLERLEQRVGGIEVGIQHKLGEIEQEIKHLAELVKLKNKNPTVVMPKWSVILSGLPSLVFAVAALIYVLRM